MLTWLANAKKEKVVRHAPYVFFGSSAYFERYRGFSKQETSQNFNKEKVEYKSMWKSKVFIATSRRGKFFSQIGLEDGIKSLSWKFELNRTRNRFFKIKQNLGKKFLNALYTCTSGVAETLAKKSICSEGRHTKDFSSILNSIPETLPQMLKKHAAKDGESLATKKTKTERLSGILSLSLFLVRGRVSIETHAFSILTKRPYFDRLYHDRRCPTSGFGNRMTFSYNPEKLSLFGGGCNESATFSELFRLVWRTTPCFSFSSWRRRLIPVTVAETAAKNQHLAASAWHLRFLFSSKRKESLLAWPIKTP